MHDDSPAMIKSFTNLLMGRRARMVNKSEETALSLLNKIYDHVNAELVSKNDRVKLNMDEDNFIYGEIVPASFVRILERASPQPGEVFYDLGSGSGKALLTAALHYDFSEVIGIELLPGLCQLANNLVFQANEALASSHQAYADIYLRRLSSIKIVADNFHHQDISSADIVFINATCFSYGTWEKMIDSLESIKNGSRVIVTSKKIKRDQFLLLDEGLDLMGWGMNSVNIYKKVRQVLIC